MAQPSWRADRRKTAERGYGGKWQRARVEYLTAHPFCERCEAEGHKTLATVVNHRVPHRGDTKLFWDRTNWEPTCEPHHNSTIQREERSGRVMGVDRDGRPTDPGHAWNV